MAVAAQELAPQISVSKSQDPHFFCVRMLFLKLCIKIGTSSVKTSEQRSIGKVILTLSRRCILANLRGSSFRIS